MSQALRSEPWLTKAELASRLKVSPRTIERLDLPSMQVGGQKRYMVSEVEAFLRGERRRAEVVALRGGEEVA
jgi:predicted DNA-binding transcriptional regulator YafY